MQLDPNLGRSIQTDSKRLQQVLKNLLSNAFKFTEDGSVRLTVSSATEGWTSGHPVLGSVSSVVAFRVEDTGIGIAPEKQKIIFEAFQQADAGTSRKYGGTGLGLAISRELAGLLGGEIQLHSATGRGSAFTLYLPQRYAGPRATATTAEAARRENLILLRQPQQTSEAIEDDRELIAPGDPVLLLVEDDPHYASLMMNLARREGFKVLLAARGADALAMAQEYKPTAVSLDVFLPDMLGWSVLGQLKQDPELRHIPVQMLTLDEDRQHGLSRGAFAFLTKPASADRLQSALSRIRDYSQSPRKRLLVVEDDPAERLSITQLLGHDDIVIENVETGTEALHMLRTQGADCVVLDLKLPDMSGFDVLEHIRDDAALRDVPVVVYTGRELSARGRRAAAFHGAQRGRQGCRVARAASG